MLPSIPTPNFECIQRQQYGHPERMDEEISDIGSDFMPPSLPSGQSWPPHFISFLIVGDPLAGKSTFLQAFSEQQSPTFQKFLSFIPLLQSSFMNAQFTIPKNCENCQKFEKHAEYQKHQDHQDPKSCSCQSKSQTDNFEAENSIIKPTSRHLLDTDVAQGSLLLTFDDFLYFLSEFEILSHQDLHELSISTSKSQYINLHFTELGGHHLDRLAKWIQESGKKHDACQVALKNQFLIEFNLNRHPFFKKPSNNSQCTCSTLQTHFLEELDFKLHRTLSWVQQANTLIYFINFQTLFQKMQCQTNGATSLIDTAHSCRYEYQLQPLALQEMLERLAALQMCLHSHPDKKIASHAKPLLFLACHVPSEPLYILEPNPCVDNSTHQTETSTPAMLSDTAFNLKINYDLAMKCFQKFLWMPNETTSISLLHFFETLPYSPFDMSWTPIEDEFGQDYQQIEFKKKVEQNSHPLVLFISSLIRYLWNLENDGKPIWSQSFQIASIQVMKSHQRRPEPFASDEVEPNQTLESLNACDQALNEILLPLNQLQLDVINIVFTLGCFLQNSDILRPPKKAIDNSDSPYAFVDITGDLGATLLYHFVSSTIQQRNQIKQEMSEKGNTSIQNTTQYLFEFRPWITEKYFSHYLEDMNYAISPSSSPSVLPGIVILQNLKRITEALLYTHAFLPISLENLTYVDVDIQIRFSSSSSGKGIVLRPCHEIQDPMPLSEYENFQKNMESPPICCRMPLNETFFETLSVFLLNQASFSLPINFWTETWKPFTFNSRDRLFRESRIFLELESNLHSTLKTLFLYINMPCPISGSDAKHMCDAAHQLYNVVTDMIHFLILSHSSTPFIIKMHSESSVVQSVELNQVAEKSMWNVSVILKTPLIYNLSHIQSWSHSCCSVSLQWDAD